MQQIKKIQDLLDILREKNLLVDTKSLDPGAEVWDLAFDSRKVVPGTLFFCKGRAFQTSFLDAAIRQGAVAYVSEEAYAESEPLILVKDIRLAMIETAAFFFDYPDKKLTLVGVTGTKGKSTTVTILKEIFDKWLNEQGKPAACLISGLYNFDGKVREESHLTTPEAIDLYHILFQAVQNGLTHAIIEVSSQALKYDRVTRLSFDAVGFLNIGLDHISPLEHPDFEDYFTSKLKILSLAPVLVYNKSMDLVDQVEAKADQLGIRRFSFALDLPADFSAEKIREYPDRTEFSVQNQAYQLKLIGRYNLENAMCAVALAQLVGIDPETVRSALAGICAAPHSKFCTTKDKKIAILVDYAHNKMSFDRSYEMIQNLFPSSYLVTLFGAGGEKALNRREDLARSADRHSQEIYIIPDDPGTENQDHIASEIVRHFGPHTKFQVRYDREKGLREAFEQAKERVKSRETQGQIPETQVLFIAGKGEESYLYIEGEYRTIRSDLEVAEELISFYDQAL